ncbi:MAG: hypothetical protein JWO76_1306 [Nocardioides sp.]|nr:hypothetical protein [Nocardioides sp.]
MGLDEPEGDTLRTTPLGARTRLVLTSLLVTSALLLAACGGSDDPKVDPTPSTSPTSPSASASDDPTESASPSVEPATGKLVDTSRFTVRVPEKWVVIVAVKDFSITASDLETGDSISFGLVDLTTPTGLDVLADRTQRTGPWVDPPARAPDSTLAGMGAYHLVGPVGKGERVDVLGTVRAGKDVVVIFDVYGPQSRLDKLKASVLATWKWK